jgi:CDP-diacylglycerol pyrophosphatase
MRPLLALAAAGAVLAAIATVSQAAPDPRLKLWERAQQCVDEARKQSLKYPCVRASKSLEYVIVDDTEIGKRGVYMILPTVRVSGIEDPAVLDKPLRQFFEYGWEALNTHIKRPPQDLAMAINNKTHRTQDQFHIHLACVAPEVRTALDSAKLTGHWQDNAIKVKGREFAAIELASLARSPFEVLQDHLASKQPKASLGDYSLAVIGQANGRFVVLATSTAPAELVLEEGDSCQKAKH